MARCPIFFRTSCQVGLVVEMLAQPAVLTKCRCDAVHLEMLQVCAGAEAHLRQWRGRLFLLLSVSPVARAPKLCCQYHDFSIGAESAGTDTAGWKSII